MKREGHVIERIATRQNFGAAFTLAARGKRNRPEVVAFSDDLDSRLGELVEAVRTGGYQPGPYRRFTVRDPKVRVIHAAPFADRVVQHAVMRIALPVFERGALDVSFACRKGRGTDAALKRALRFTRRYPRAIHLDVRRYFDSVDHEILLGLMGRLFKDEAFLAMMGRILSSYQTESCCGLPIGTLCSQVWANLYLDGLDRHVCEQLGKSSMVRFMDDLVVWGEDDENLLAIAGKVSTWLDQERALALKGRPKVKRCADGFVFLGRRVTRRGILPSRAARKRFVARREALERAWAMGELDEAELQRRCDALVAAVGGRCGWTGMGSWA